MLLFCMIIMAYGCATYRVTSDRSLQGKRGYEVIDTAIKRTYVGWTGPDVSKIGADENGFTVCEITGSTPISRSGYTGTLHYGRTVTYRWANIEDVRVRAEFGGILLCGILDPTLGSCVRLKFKDGTSKDIRVPTSLMFIAPLWIVSSGWSKAHKLGKVFQTVVDSLKQGPNHGVK